MSFLVDLQHSAQETSDIKYIFSPGAWLWSEPHTNALFGANTSGDNCISHTKKHEIVRETMSFNDEHFHTLWVSHLDVWG